MGKFDFFKKGIFRVKNYYNMDGGSQSMDYLII